MPAVVGWNTPRAFKLTYFIANSVRSRKMI
jgi:hypothetical protein